MSTQARWSITCDGPCFRSTTEHPTRGGAEAEAIDAGWTIESDRVARCPKCAGAS